MKGGLGAPKSELSKAPLPSISAYDSLQITNSTNIAGYSSSPIPVSDLDKIDVASLLSPQFGEVNKEAIKSATYQPISMHKIQRDNIFKRIEKVFASFYFKNTVLVKFIMFIVYYIVGVSYYSTEEPWTILESIYFISESVTTIGTGYFHPTGDEAKLFTMFYVVVGVSLIISFSTTFVRTVLTGSQDELSGLLHRLLYGPDCVPLTDRVIISYRVKLSLFGVFLVLLVGTLFFNGNEGWGWLNSLYWCVCLMTTIGYGDMLIQYESTRVFAIFYIYISVLTFAVTINNIAEYWLAYLKRKQLRERLVLMTARHFGDEWCRRTLKSSPSTAQHNSRLQPGSGGIPGKVDKERFILSVLAELGVLNYRRDIAPLALKFAELDHMNQGYLTHSQLLEFRQTMEQVSRVAQGVAVEYESTENDIFNHLDRSDAYWMPQAPMEASNTVHVSSIDDHKEFKNPVSNLHDIQMSTTRDETAVDLE